MKHLNKKLIIILSIFCFLLTYNKVIAASSFNDGLQNSGKEMGYTDATISLTQEAGSTMMISKITKIINTALSIVGTLFLVLMIYGGFIWMNARGNETETKKAQDIIRNAIIGIIVVFAAYAITGIITNVFTATSSVGTSVDDAFIL